MGGSSVTCAEQKPPRPQRLPRRVPTMGQIKRRSGDLPFSKPTVRVEPKGNVTLVNPWRPTRPRGLTTPAFSRVRSASRFLALLVRGVQDQLALNTFRYGDRTSSGPVQEAGGGYPDGAIKHTYSKPIEAAQVTVDSQLTGEFRVNGGEWIDIDTVANLQNEPVTTLAVKESGPASTATDQRATGSSRAFAALLGRSRGPHAPRSLPRPRSCPRCERPHPGWATGLPTRTTARR